MTYEVNISDDCPAWWNHFKYDFLSNPNRPKAIDLEAAVIAELAKNKVRVEHRSVANRDLELWLVFETEADATMFVLRWS